MKQVAKFCDPCCEACPTLSVDETAPPEKQMVFHDDFGGENRWSKSQLKSFFEQVKSGELDHLIE